MTSTLMNKQASLPNVAGTVRWCSNNPKRDLECFNCSCLLITVERKNGVKEQSFYWLHLGNSFDANGFTLRKEAQDRSGFEEHELSADLTVCDCNDFRYRAHQREDGFCKHLKGVRAALAKILA